MQGVQGVHAQPLGAARAACGRPACGRARAAPQCSAASTPAPAPAHAAAVAAALARRERGSRVVAHASSGGEEESAVFGFLKKVQGGLPVIGLVRAACARRLGLLSPLGGYERAHAALQRRSRAVGAPLASFMPALHALPARCHALLHIPR
jgi:phage terminase large subunit-like protein